MKCYLYARIDAAPMVDERLLDMQIESLQAYAAHTNMTVAGIIRAAGESGTEAWRPSTLMLAAALKEHPADVVLAVNYNRLAKPVEAVLELAEEFEKLGATIVSLREGKLRLHPTVALYFRVATSEQLSEEEQRTAITHEL